MAAVIRRLQKRKVKMAGDHGIAPFTEPFSSVAPDQQRASVDAALFFCPAADAPPAEAVRDEAGDPSGDNRDQRLDDWTVEQGAQHPVGQFAPIDLVAVTDQGPFPVKLDDGRSAMDLGAESLGEERPKVKIVVSLAVDDPGARGLEVQEAIEDGTVVGKLPDRIADEEFEEIAHDDQQVRFSFLTGEKGEKRLVISIFGLTEVGIC